MKKQNKQLRRTGGKIKVKKSAKPLNKDNFIFSPERKKVDSLTLEPRKLKVKIVALGGGGASILAEIAPKIKGASFLAIDTDTRTVQKLRYKNKIKTLLFGEKKTAGSGTGMDPGLALEAALEEKDKVAKALAGQDLCIFIGCLGGGVASGAGTVFAQISREQKSVNIGIFTLPFDFEGEKKEKIAKKALIELREKLNAVIAIHNEKIFQLVDKKTSLKKSLSSLNQVFANWLAELFETISQPNLINIDFADLKSILGGRGEDLFFNQILTYGPSRGEEATRKIFQSLLLNQGPQKPKRMLFNIVGGSDLAIKEVELISRKIASLNEKAKIIFGISQNQKYKGKIKVSLIALSSPETEDKKIVSAIQPKIKKIAKAKTAKKMKFIQKKLQTQLPNKNNQIKEIGSDKTLEDYLNLLPGAEKNRRTGVEAQEAKKANQEKEWSNDRHWEVPTFLRSRK